MALNGHILLSRPTTFYTLGLSEGERSLVLISSQCDMTKLTKDCLALKLLRARIKSRQITGDDPPKQVWKSDPSFKLYNLANFRTCYNRLRKELESEDVERARFSANKVFLDL